MMKIEKQKELAKSNFRNHIATFIQYDGISVLNWRNQNGSSMYYIRYVFDENMGLLYISGDSGSAVLRFTEQVSLKSVAKSVDTMDYFMRKVVCSTGVYTYDCDKAEEDLKERYLDETLIAELLECFDLRNGIQLSDKSLMNRLENIDSDYWEWIGSIGKEVDIRVILWVVGLNMAYEQLESKNISWKK